VRLRGGGLLHGAGALTLRREEDLCCCDEAGSLFEAARRVELEHGPDGGHEPNNIAAVSEKEALGDVVDCGGVRLVGPSRNVRVVQNVADEVGVVVLEVNEHEEEGHGEEARDEILAHCKEQGYRSVGADEVSGGQAGHDEEGPVGVNEEGILRFYRFAL